MVSRRNRAVGQWPVL